jgi:RNA polymerase sigma-70 factor (ECF subfamily)
VFRLCCAYCADPDDRLDLLQMIFLNVWKNLDSFEARSKIGTWIYRIAVNTALLYIKRENRRKSLFRSSAIEGVYTTRRSQPDIILDDREDVNMLYTAINRLPELDRLIITMTLDELSYKQIADVTGLTANHIGVKVNRIKKTLAAYIKEIRDGKQ